MVEEDFANRLEKDNRVKLYAKLPDWFKIPMTIGTYNPDRAILYEMNNQQRFYFVIETKSTLDIDELRGNESYKIACGKTHFNALKSAFDLSLKYDLANSYEVVKIMVE